MPGRPWTVTDRTFVRDHARRPSAWIAARLGRTAAAVRMLKKRLRVGRGFARVTPALLAALRGLHALGLSDALAALRLGVSADSARRWRLRLGLPANGWSALTRGQQSRRASRAARRRADSRLADEEYREGERRDASRVAACRATNETHSAEQAEFLAAVDAFRRRVRRVPTLAEGLRLAKSLGWRREDDPITIPEEFR